MQAILNCAVRDAVLVMDLDKDNPAVVGCEEICHSIEYVQLGTFDIYLEHIRNRTVLNNKRLTTNDGDIDGVVSLSALYQTVLTTSNLVTMEM